MPAASSVQQALLMRPVFIWPVTNTDVVGRECGVCRRTDAQGSHTSSSEYRPPASLLDLWSKWNNPIEDIGDCTVICVR